VNVRRVVKASPGKFGDGEIILDEGTKLRVSRTFRDKILQTSIED